MSFCHGTYLQKMGLTNKETPALRELTRSKRRTVHAFCSSAPCTKPLRIVRNSSVGKIPSQTYKIKEIQKNNVKRNATFCPDCGSALLWRTTYE